MNKPWKIVLLLLAIFAAGGVSGWFLSQSTLRNAQVKHTRPEDWAPQHLKRLVDRLELSNQQADQVLVILQRSSEDMIRLRNNSFVETRKILDRMRQEVAEKLTPEQREKYDQLNKEQRDRIKKSMPERANRTGKGDNPEPPPAPDKPAGN